MQYVVKLSDDAQYDFDNYIDYIMLDCGAPLTAIKHYEGITKALTDLSENPFAYAVRYNASLMRYGKNVRRVNYKKMAIIYTVYENTVKIHRIISGNMVID